MDRDRSTRARQNMAYRLDRLASRDQTRRMLEALKTVARSDWRRTVS